MNKHVMIGKISASGDKFILTREYTWILVKDFLKANIKPQEFYDMGITSLMLGIMTDTECEKGDILHVIRFGERGYINALRKWVTKNFNIAQTTSKVTV